MNNIKYIILEVSLLKSNSWMHLCSQLNSSTSIGPIPRVIEQRNMELRITIKIKS